MRENCDFVVPVNILYPFARASFSWAVQQSLDMSMQLRLDSV